MAENNFKDDYPDSFLGRTFGSQENFLSKIDDTSLSPNSQFDELHAATLLKDHRRTRTKSAGRPPSQMFMKESIFQTSFSLEDDDLINDEVIESRTSSRKFSQIVEQVQMSKTVIDGNAAMSKIIQRNWKVPALKKVAPLPPVEIPSMQKQPAPWMREIQARKHKLSLRGDEFMKVEEPKERKVLLRVNSVKLEPKDIDQNLDEQITIETHIKQPTTIEENLVKNAIAEDLEVIKSHTVKVITSKNQEPELIDKIEVKIVNPKVEIPIAISPPIIEVKKEAEMKETTVSVKYSLQDAIKNLENLLANVENFREEMHKQLNDFKKSIDNQIYEEMKTLEELKKELLTFAEDG